MDAECLLIPDNGMLDGQPCRERREMRGCCTNLFAVVLVAAGEEKGAAEMEGMSVMGVSPLNKWDRQRLL